MRQSLFAHLHSFRCNTSTVLYISIPYISDSPSAVHFNITEANSTKYITHTHITSTIMNMEEEEGTHSDCCCCCCERSTIAKDNDSYSFYRLDPCGCHYCGPCMVQFLAETRLQQPLACRSCRVTVQSHYYYSSTAAINTSTTEGSSAGAPVQQPFTYTTTTTTTPSTTATSVAQTTSPPDISHHHKTSTSAARNTKRPAKRRRLHSRPPQVKSSLPTCEETTNKDETSLPVLLPKQQPRQRTLEKRKKKSFDERVSDLLAHKERHGHVHVTTRCVEHPSLGEWVKDIRRGHLKITYEQRRRLNQIGFNWETRTNQRERAWKERLEQLTKYSRKNNGDYCRRLSASRNNDDDDNDDKTLAEWCNTQRKLYKKDALRKDRKEALDKIGFVWGGGGTGGGAAKVVPQQQQQQQHDTFIV